MSDLTNTEQVYKPINDHEQANAIAVENWKQAMHAGDLKAAQKYFDEASYHEQMVRESGIKARQYFLGKVHP